MTDEEKRQTEVRFSRARPVLELLNEYAAKEMKASQFTISNPKAFETPNWQYHMAWMGGYNTAMRKMVEYTTT